MQTLTIKNLTKSPTFINAANGRRIVEPNEEVVDIEFTEGEARNIKANTAVFEVKGYVDGHTDDDPAPAPQPAIDGHAGTLAAANDRAVAAESELAKLRAGLHDLALLFDPERSPDDAIDLEAIGADIRDLKEQVAKFDPDGNGRTGGGAGDDAKLSLPDAIASLDDKNDAHWTQGGLPDLDVLKGLTGNADLKRADVTAAFTAPATEARTRKVDQ